MNVLNQPVLSLNAIWLPISIKNVKEALIAMMGGTDGKSPAALAVNQEFSVNDDGDINWNDMIYATPVTWDEWIKLPVREGHDLAIHSCNMVIRAPRVIVQPNFSKMPIISPRPTKDAIRKRDGGKCQYTGKQLTWNESNIDHVIPRAQGGKNTFDNMVLSCKDINSVKANRTPAQAGLKLIRKPVAPKSMPISMTFNVALHPSWIHFLPSLKEVKNA